MKRACVGVAALLLTGLQPATAIEWRLDLVPTPGAVKAIDTSGEEPLVAIGGGWFRFVAGTSRLTLGATAGPIPRPLPDGALPDGRVAYGQRDVARAWFTGLTDRYRNGVIGDSIEASTVMIERRDGTRERVWAGDDAVFEDLEPRIVAFEAGGREYVVAVKSYLDKGSALAVIGERAGRYTILAETPPTGTARQWLNPVAVADFLGDRTATIALVTRPHVIGRLELWRFRDSGLTRLIEVPDAANHVAGSRVLRMSATADFDGDGRADVAIASLDRRALRLIAFAPGVRDIARLALPARAITEIAAIKDHAGKPAVALGLENGSLAIARQR